MYENYSVLFVDDEIHILSSLRRGLIDEEFTCYFAESGKAALELMEKKPVHVIVTDMRMPEMTGLVLLKHVTDQWPKTVKIVLSGYTQLQQIVTTINQVDIFKFITKPWDLDDFIAIVHKALDYYILQEENERNKKTLEAQNLAYQNILKRVDDVVANAKKSTELLCTIGKAVYGFEKKLPIKERIRFESFFAIQDTIFDSFCKAVTNEKREYTYSSLSESLLAYMSKNFPYVMLETENDTNTKFMFNIKLIETTLYSIMLVFKDEFERSAPAFRIGLKDENKISITILFYKQSSQSESDHSKDPDLFDIKLDFIRYVLETVVKIRQIEFQMTQIKENIILQISIIENTHE